MFIEIIKKKKKISKAKYANNVNSFDSTTSEKENTFKSVNRIRTKNIKSFAIKFRKVNNVIFSYDKESAFYIKTISFIHIIWNRTKFTFYKSLAKKNKKILFEIGKISLKILDIETTILSIIVNNSVIEIELIEIYHISNINYNLLFIEILKERDYHYTIRDDWFNVINDDEIIFSRTRVNKSYLLNLKYSTSLKILRSFIKSLVNNVSWDV